VADRLRAFFYLQSCITCFHDQQGDNPTSRKAAYIPFGVDSGHVAADDFRIDSGVPKLRPFLKAPSELQCAGAGAKDRE
jgi:hypothetical protein